MHFVCRYSVSYPVITSQVDRYWSPMLFLSPSPPLLCTMGLHSGGRTQPMRGTLGGSWGESNGKRTLGIFYLSLSALSGVIYTVAISPMVSALSWLHWFSLAPLEFHGFSMIHWLPQSSKTLMPSRSNDAIRITLLDWD